ncbi:MAG: alpha/beta hydrolase-fold protein [Saprospiraceae bacterium]
MRSLAFLLLCINIPVIPIHAQSPLPQVVGGKIERIEQFQSEFISARTVDVWLPEGYSDSIQYAVLYMHDGQMLFDPEQTWNKQAWNADDVASELLAQGRLEPFILVGIWNGGATRHTDYFPQQPFVDLSQAEQDTVTAQLKRAGRTREAFMPQSDGYLKFIVNELKPYIDTRYSVATGKEHTFVAGSSMGGLISMYALCEYPEVFGGAACLSTHWIGTFSPENNPVPDAFLRYLENKLPDPGEHKIYFDCGDQTLDAFYPEIQQQVDALLIEKGYDQTNWLTRYFPGENHSEDAWNKRLHIPLEFLLKK